MVLCMPLLKVELLRFTFRLWRKLRKVRAATQCSESRCRRSCRRLGKHPGLSGGRRLPQAAGKEAAKCSPAPGELILEVTSSITSSMLKCAHIPHSID